MSSSRIRWCAVLLFLVGLAVVWAIRGIHEDKEALKYIGCARDLLHGGTEDLFGRYKGYASYVIFLLPFVALNATWMAVAAQAALAIRAAFALARLVDRSSGTAMAGTTTLVIALFCYPFQEWVLTLYTESFFASIAILFVERVTRPGRADWLSWGLAFILLFARPNGILFILPALIWRFYGLSGAPARLRPLAYAAVLFLVMLFPGVPREHLGVIVEGHVICGFPERTDALNEFQGTTILDAQRFLFRDPAYAVGLFSRRLISLFTITRPYFSSLHNLALLPLYALYAFAALGWWRSRKHVTTGLLVAILLLNAALIGLTYDEWNGRFLVPIWPILFVFGAMGVRRACEQILSLR